MKIKKIEIIKPNNRALIYLDQSDKEILEVCLPESLENNKELKDLAAKNNCSMDCIYGYGLNFYDVVSHKNMVSINPNEGIIHPSKTHFDIAFQEEAKELAEKALKFVYEQSLGEAVIDYMKHNKVVVKRNVH